MKPSLQQIEAKKRKEAAIKLYLDLNGEISMKQLGNQIGVTDHCASDYISQYFKERKKKIKHL